MEQQATMWVSLRQYRQCWCTLLMEKECAHDTQILKLACRGIVPQNWWDAPEEETNGN